MIGGAGEGGAKPRGKRRAGKKAQGRVRAQRSARASRIKKIARLKEKGLKASQIAKRVGVQRHDRIQRPEGDEKRAIVEVCPRLLVQVPGHKSPVTGHSSQITGLQPAACNR